MNSVFRSVKIVPMDVLLPYWVLLLVISVSLGGTDPECVDLSVYLVKQASIVAPKAVLYVLTVCLVVLLCKKARPFVLNVKRVRTLLEVPKAASCAHLVSFCFLSLLTEERQGEAEETWKSAKGW